MRVPVPRGSYLEQFYPRRDRRAGLMWANVASGFSRKTSA